MQDDFVVLRNIRVPRHQVDELRLMFGAEPLMDDDPLLPILDKALAFYRESHGRDPDSLVLAGDGTVRYKHCALTVPIHALGGIRVPVEHKPAWFRLPRIFKGVTRA